MRIKTVYNTVWVHTIGKRSSSTKSSDISSAIGCLNPEVKEGIPDSDVVERLSHEITLVSGTSVAIARYREKNRHMATRAHAMASMLSPVGIVAPLKSTTADGSAVVSPPIQSPLGVPISASSIYNLLGAFGVADEAKRWRDVWERWDKTSYNQALERCNLAYDTPEQVIDRLKLENYVDKALNTVDFKEQRNAVTQLKSEINRRSKDKEDLNILLKHVYTTRGSRSEEPVFNDIDASSPDRVLKQDPWVYRQLYLTGSGNIWRLGGSIDGYFQDGTILEIKNRQKRLSWKLLPSDYLQMQAYFALTDSNQGELVEKYGTQSKMFSIKHDLNLWKTTIEFLTVYVDAFMKMVNSNSLQDKFLHEENLLQTVGIEDFRTTMKNHDLGFRFRSNFKPAVSSSMNYHFYPPPLLSLDNYDKSFKIDYFPPPLLSLDNYENGLKNKTSNSSNDVPKDSSDKSTRNNKI